MLGFSRACVLAKDLADCFSRMQKELNLLVISARRFRRQCRYANRKQEQKTDEDCV